MGKGVGKPKGYCYFIDKGCILFEIWNKTKINNNNLIYALNKLGLKCKLISKQILEKKYIKDSTNKLKIL
jgi:ribosomal protein L16/L10AE